jgi:hypothetical protein
MVTPKRKRAAGYGYELIRLEKPREELCQSWAHFTRRATAVPGGTSQSDERLSHVCQWRYRRLGVEVVARRWVCRGCAIDWARAHIWKKTKTHIRRLPVTDYAMRKEGDGAV